MVRANLADALYCLRRLRVGRLWVDVLQINQKRQEREEWADSAYEGDLVSCRAHLFVA